MRAGVVVALCMLACRSERTPPAARTPAETLALARRFVTIRDAKDLPAATAMMSPAIASLVGDPVAGVADYGRDRVLETWKKRSSVDTCLVELALADAHDAIVLLHCTSIVTVKVEPKQRTRKLFRVYELAFDDRGLLARIVGWWDGLRSLRQLGVDEPGDPRPDVPSGRSLVALARGDAAEAANAEHARRIVAAMDRRDFAAFARSFADGYVRHRFSEPEPQTFPTGAELARSVESEYACDASTARVYTTLAAADWVAVRYGHGCRKGADQSFATHLWLLRFEHGRVVESWDTWARQEEMREAGLLSVAAQRERSIRAGF